MTAEFKLDNGPIVRRTEAALVRFPDGATFAALAGVLRVGKGRHGMLSNALAQLRRKGIVEHDGDLWRLVREDVTHVAPPPGARVCFEIRRYQETTWVVGWLPDAPHITRQRWIPDGALRAVVEAAKQRVVVLLTELPAAAPPAPPKAPRRRRSKV